MAGVLDVLLDLPLFPARRRIAKIRVEQVMTDHRRESRIDLAVLAAANELVPLSS
jgi:hypothetical protein